MEVEYAMAEVIFSDVPSGYRPTAMSVKIERFVDGVKDQNFIWLGGLSSWNA